MTDPGSLPFRAELATYEREAEALFEALQNGDDSAAWRFKWEHPHFRGQSVQDVRAASLDIADARTVIAREHAFATWSDLSELVRAVTCDDAAAKFEEAVEAVVSGDVDALRAMLRDDPRLVHARSTRRHHSTLLHYLGANGVEGGRQRTPPNAVEVAKLLLDSGAEANAPADLYDAPSTTLSMVVSSAHPARAGVQAALAETLLDYDGVETNCQSAIVTALAFGYAATAHALARRAESLTLTAAAGLGRVDDVRRLFPSADAQSRHIALALAAQHGHAAVVQLLLEAGEDPNRYNPEGFHAHSTPLHQAVWSDHIDVVRLLVGRGARLDLTDKVYSATPLEWAVHGGRTSIADYLRDVSALTDDGRQGP
jgi:hypothetical protein